MKKSIGNVVVIDTQPAYRRWDGNQATYLFFPVFASFVLTLIGTLSANIIPGLGTIEVHAKSGEGVVQLGAWGMCINGFPDRAAECIPYSIFKNNSQALADLPTGILAMGIIPSPVTDEYKIANGIMHVLASVISWLTVIWTLVAAGEFHDKGKFSWNWTRWAWWGNTTSLLVGIVPFAMDIALLPKTAKAILSADESHGTVYPGASIYMSTAAITLNLVTLFVRYLWSRRQPRPSFTTSDFHVEPLGPGQDRTPASGFDGLVGQGIDQDASELGLGMAYPHSGVDSKDEPPTWESLNLDSAIRPTEKEWSRADGALESIEEKRGSFSG